MTGVKNALEGNKKREKHRRDISLVFKIRLTNKTLLIKIKNIKRCCAMETGMNIDNMYLSNVVLMMYFEKHPPKQKLGDKQTN